MKIVYFKRKGESFHTHATPVGNMFYIPDKNVVIGKESAGTFSETHPFITEKEYFLKEAKAVADALEKGNEITHYEDDKISDTQIIEYENDDNISRIIEKLTERITISQKLDALESEIDESMKSLFERLNKVKLF